MFALRSLLPALTLILGSAGSAFAGQLEWMSKSQATKAKTFIEHNNVKMLLVWAACTDAAPTRMLTISRCYLRETANAKLYELIVVGKDVDGRMYEAPIDLADTWIQEKTKAVNLGLKLGFRLEPCSPSFAWPK